MNAKQEGGRTEKKEGVTDDTDSGERVDCANDITAMKTYLRQ